MWQSRVTLGSGADGVSGCCPAECVVTSVSVTTMLVRSKQLQEGKVEF